MNARLRKFDQIRGRKQKVKNDGLLSNPSSVWQAEG
jgi:hypothetical protein